MLAFSHACLRNQAKFLAKETKPVGHGKDKMLTKWGGGVRCVEVTGLDSHIIAEILGDGAKFNLFLATL